MSYTLKVPLDWEIQRHKNDFDITVSHGTLFVGVAAEELDLGSAKAAVSVARTILGTRVASLSVTEPKPISLCGREWLQFTAKGVADGIPAAYEYYVYSGPEGTYQIKGWTVQSLFERDHALMTAVMQTFRFPVVIGDGRVPETRSGGIAASVPRRVVKGEDMAFTIELPVDWTVERNHSDYAVLARHHTLYVGVIAENLNLGDPNTVLQFAEDHLRQAASDVMFTKPTPFRLCEREWLQFIANARVDGISMSFWYYIYSGPAGTYQIIGGTSQNLFDRDYEVMTRVMETFRFPAEVAGETVPLAGVRTTGSGFFVTEDGYLLTSYHVVRNADKILVQAKNRKSVAKLLKWNTPSDLALLKVEGSFRALPIAPGGSIQLGEPVFTIGFPNTTIQGTQPKFTRGEISSLSGIQDDPCHFQISVPVQPGNSGGPLISLQGSVVGIVRLRLDDEKILKITGSLPQNVNYAVKSSSITALLNSVPGLPAKLKQPYTAKERKFEDVVKEAQDAAALVLIY